MFCVVFCCLLFVCYCHCSDPVCFFLLALVSYSHLQANSSQSKSLSPLGNSVWEKQSAPPDETVSEIHLTMEAILALVGDILRCPFPAADPSCTHWRHPMPADFEWLLYALTSKNRGPAEVPAPSWLLSTPSASGLRCEKCIHVPQRKSIWVWLETAVPSQESQEPRNKRNYDAMEMEINIYNKLRGSSDLSVIWLLICLFLIWACFFRTLKTTIRIDREFYKFVNFWKMIIVSTLQLGIPTTWSYRVDSKY